MYERFERLVRRWQNVTSRYCSVASYISSIDFHNTSEPSRTKGMRIKHVSPHGMISVGRVWFDEDGQEERNFRVTSSSELESTDFSTHRAPVVSKNDRTLS